MGLPVTAIVTRGDTVKVCFIISFYCIFLVRERPEGMMNCEGSFTDAFERECGCRARRGYSS